MARVITLPCILHVVFDDRHRVMFRSDEQGIMRAFWMLCTCVYGKLKTWLIASHPRAVALYLKGRMLISTATG